MANLQPSSNSSQQQQLQTSGRSWMSWLFDGRRQVQSQPGDPPGTRRTTSGPYFGPPIAPRPGVLGWLRDLLGGWAGPRISRQMPADRELTRERINSAPSGIILPVFEPWLDNITDETPGIRRAYRKMLSSGYVRSTLNAVIWGVASLDLQIHPADKKNARDVEVAKFVEWNLTERLHGMLCNLVESILLGALIDGYSINEKVWGYEEKGRWSGKYILRQLKPKQVREDAIVDIDQFGNIVSVMALRYNSGEHYHPGHFVIHRHQPIYNAPNGLSLLRGVYQAWVKLDTAEKLRLIALQTRSIPPLIGTYNNSTYQDALDAALSSMKSQGWASVPEGVKMEVLAMMGDTGFFEAASRDFKHDIVYAIQGSILASLEGQTSDGAGNSQVHKSTSDLIRFYLARQIEALLNDREGGIIADIVDLNYDVSEYPKATLSAVDVTEMAAELQIARQLNSMGVPLSLEELRERAGWKAPTSPADTLAGSQQQLNQINIHGAPGLPGADQDTRNPLVPPRPFSEEAAPGASPFRFSDEWQQHVGGGNAAGNGPRPR